MESMDHILNHIDHTKPFGLLICRVRRLFPRMLFVLDCELKGETVYENVVRIGLRIEGRDGIQSMRAEDHCIKYVSQYFSIKSSTTHPLFVHFRTIYHLGSLLITIHLALLGRMGCTMVQATWNT